ncbi:type IV pilus biogenesis protein PilM [Guptibacillus algicola]|uniref:type IV pilus biogenesis protein PilM n=1 Tax=Guptibacillus algicola TaxID=225844 RepID=UPI001CD65A68|nr:pilus assembly protein PilM [Alkalihalobacillus algicola]MCA0986221.1 pilus assembly protein PilM [Alkalihalobacillus algicola]
MRFLGLKPQTKQISLALYDHVIRMVEINKGDRSLRVYHERFLPNDIIKNGKIIERETLKDILVECVEEWGIKKKKVQFLVPDTYLVLRNEKLPLTVSDDEIKGHLYLEIGSSIKLPFNEAVFDYELVRTTEEHKEILLFAAPEHIVTDLSTLLESVSLRPEAADVTALSLYRLYYHHGLIDQYEPTLIIHAGIQTMNVSVFYNHQPAFIRQILMDTPYSKWEVHSTSRVSESLKWSGDQNDLHDKIEESITEIERVINFYYYSMNRSGKTIQTAFLSGDFPEIDLLNLRLEETLAIPVKGETKSEIKDEDGLALPMKYYTAMGLALKGCSDAD